MKNPLTPAGIEPTTFRFEAQHLNHCANTVPSDLPKNEINTFCQQKYITATKCSFIECKAIIILLTTQILGNEVEKKTHWSSKF